MGISEHKRGVCMCVRVCACAHPPDAGTGDLPYRESCGAPPENVLRGKEVLAEMPCGGAAAQMVTGVMLPLAWSSGSNGPPSLCVRAYDVCVYDVCTCDACVPTGTHAWCVSTFAQTHGAQMYVCLHVCTYMYIYACMVRALVSDVFPSSFNPVPRVSASSAGSVQVSSPHTAGMDVLVVALLKSTGVPVPFTSLCWTRSLGLQEAPVAIRCPSRTGLR